MDNLSVLPFDLHCRTVFVAALQPASEFLAPGRRFSAAELAAALGISSVLALLVWVIKAGTRGAALAGSGCCFALLLLRPRQDAGFVFSGFAPLLALLVMTTAASRMGRERKAARNSAENTGGRDWGQVLANLGVAALAVFLPSPWNAVAATAALAESAADTLASEAGVLARQERVRLITGGTAPAGTDGGVTLLGTAAGLAGAACICGIAASALSLGWRAGAVCCFAGVFGCLFDSLLGATLERQGRIKNNGVNFLSTLASALLACALFELLGR